MLGGGVGIQPLSFRASRQAALPILPPDVEESLMRRFVEGGMSGIASVANLLDLPGSSIRDIASSIATGKMVNPLDQYLTPFSAENRVTGRDLLTQLNLTAPNTPTGISDIVNNPKEVARDVAGFGTELLLDPLFPISPLYKPFMGAAKVAGGAAKAGTKAAARHQPVKSVAEMLDATRRHAGALFESRYKGRTKQVGQDVAGEITDAERISVTTARERFAPHLETYCKGLFWSRQCLAGSNRNQGCIQASARNGSFGRHGR
jgi:hypothetical protein